MQAFQFATERLLGQKWTSTTAQSIQVLLANPAVRYFSIGEAGEGLAAAQEGLKGSQSVLVKKVRPVVLEAEILDQIDFKTVSNRVQQKLDGEKRPSQRVRCGLFTNLPDFEASDEKAAKHTIKFQSDLKKATVSRTILHLLEKETDLQSFKGKVDAAIHTVNLGQPAVDHILLAPLMHPAVLSFLEKFWNLVFIFNPVFDQTSPRLRFLLEVAIECLKDSDAATADKLRKAIKRLKSLLQLRCRFSRRLRGTDVGQ
jgi:hypothetical protein